jgi:hypothetical protein
MIVVGYRSTANFIEATNVIRKHTEFSLNDTKTIIENIKSGKGVKLPDDFVLRADLEDLDFLVQ